MAVVVVTAVVVPDMSPPPVDPFAQAADAFAAAEITPAELTPDARVAVVLGDSTMHRTAWGLTAWGVESTRLVVAGGSANIGCGIGRGGEVDYEGDRWPLEPICAWDESLPGVIDDARDRYGRVDVAVVQTGPWDVTNRKVDIDGDGHPEWAHIGEPVYDDWLRGELEAANDLLLERDIPVVWLTAPYIETGMTQVPLPSEPYPESDPVRIDRLNSMIRTMAETREGVTVVDLAGYLASLPPGEDDRLRPDGVHFDIETTAEVAGWLGPELLRASEAEPMPNATADAR